MEIMDFIIGILGAGIGSGVMVILNSCLQRKWQKEDKSSEQISAQTEALKVLMIDRVKRLTKEYLEQGYISLDDKETVKEMYDSYKQLGGNGHLHTAMSEIEKLEVR